MHISESPRTTPARWMEALLQRVGQLWEIVTLEEEQICHLQDCKARHKEMLQALCEENQQRAVERQSQGPGSHGVMRREHKLNIQEKERLHYILVGNILSQINISQRFREGRVVEIEETAQLVSYYRKNIEQIRFAVVTHNTEALLRKVTGFIAELIDDINILIRLQNTDFDVRGYVERHIGRYLDTACQQMVLEAIE